MAKIGKKSIIISIISLFSVLLSFLSSLVIAWIFGSGNNMDILFAATTIPLFIVSIISGSLGFAFIPVFTKYQNIEANNDVWIVANSFINLTVLVTIVASIFGFLFATNIIHITNPGFDNNQLKLTIHIYTILLPIVVLTTINELMSSIYYLHNKFYIPAFNKLISPIFTIAIVVILGDDIGVESIAYAMLTASLAQTIILAWYYIKNKEFKYLFIIDIKNSGVRSILKLMLPLLAGMIFYRAMPIYDRIFLSELPTGSISYITYAQKLLLSIPLIISSGIAVTMFPLMSEYFATDRKDEFKILVSKAIRILFFVSIPIMLFVAYYGESLIRLLFQHGDFTNIDTVFVYKAFAIYILGLPAIVSGTVVGQCYYASHDTITASMIGVVEIFCYILLSYLLVPHIGYLALPLSYTIYFYLGLFINGYVVDKKFQVFDGRNIIKSFAFFFGTGTISLVATITIQYIFNLHNDILFLILSFVIYFFISNNIFKREEALVYSNQIKEMLNAKKIFS